MTSEKSYAGYIIGIVAYLQYWPVATTSKEVVAHNHGNM